VAVGPGCFDFELRLSILIASEGATETDACGRGCYLATAKAAAGSGYGAMIVDGPVGPDGGEVLVERTLELINEMWD